ncbi:MAG: hypothetical protein K2R98_28495 [Gemmataceae bacterium]|nr:hypothetical protein [Gemmataceae bacterium]
MQRSRRFQPTFEALEGRDVPAVTIVLAPADPGILVITGDDVANEVRICQSDASDLMLVSSINGAFADQLFTSNTVHTIQLSLRGGNDRFEYSLLDDLDHAKSIVIDTGIGHDTVDIYTSEATLRNDLTVILGGRLGDEGNDTLRLYLGDMDNAAVYVNANLGNGKDNFAASFFAADPVTHVSRDALMTGVSSAFFDVNGGAGDDGIYFFGTRGFKKDFGTLWTGLDVGAQAEVRVDFNGGGGNDVLGIFYRGVLDGFFEVDAHGSADSDRVEGEIKVNSGLTQAQGEMDVNFYGDAGNDWLGLKLDVPMTMQFTDNELPFLDGGNDFDIVAMISGLVQIKNMEG